MGRAITIESTKTGERLYLPSGPLIKMVEKSTITFQDLLADASSRDPTIRQRALKLFESWVAKAPSLPTAQRLTYLERHILRQAFGQNGSRTPQSPR
jgi:hypothetical protein